MDPSPKHQRSASVSQVLSAPQPLTPISAMLSPGLLNPGSLPTPASASTPLTSASLTSASLPVSTPASDPKEDPVGLMGAAPNHRRDMSIATHYITCCKCKKKRAVPMCVRLSPVT